MHVSSFIVGRAPLRFVISCTWGERLVFVPPIVPFFVELIYNDDDDDDDGILLFCMHAWSPLYGVLHKIIVLSYRARSNTSVTYHSGLLRGCLPS